MEKQIHSFVWCTKCHQQNKPSRLEIGITHDGIQIWCKTHSMNVAHFTPEELGKQVGKGCQCHSCACGTTTDDFKK